MEIFRNSTQVWYVARSVLRGNKMFKFYLCSVSVVHSLNVTDLGVHVNFSDIEQVEPYV